jgi:nitrogen fixation NifU-like protein
MASPRRSDGTGASPLASPYPQHIVDHYRNPRNRGELREPDVSGQLDNPVCGDVVRFDLRIEGDRAAEARWSGRGCVLSLSSASLLSQAVQGLTLQELRALSDEDVFEMVGFRPGLVRSRCALLPLRALQEGLAKIED